MTRRRRFRDIRQLRVLLKRDGYPRLQMALVVAITAGAGFLATFLMLHLGLTAMWLRYTLAVVIAYVVFLGLLWLWVRKKSKDYGEVPDVGSLPDVHVSSGTHISGQGGEGGGGGASGSFDGIDVGNPLQSIDLPSVGDAVSSAAEAEEFAIPLVIVVLLVALLLAVLWAVVLVPLLIVELLVNGVLATVLYRRLRNLGSEHWIESAVLVTFWPFAVVGIVAALSGWGLEILVPDAHTVGQVVRHLKGL